MKMIWKATTGMAALLVLLAQLSLAQDKEKDKGEKKSSSDERIVITRKSDKDAKVTIEIKGNEVYINGKPADEFEDDNIRISKNRVVITPRTPFRAQGGAWSFNSNTLNLGEDYAFLGVSSEDHDKGAKITEVTEESAAAKAGLKKGDVITKVDDVKISSPSDLTKAIRKHKPEEKATITYLRDGKEQTATVTLGKRKGLLFADSFTPRVEIPDFNFRFEDMAPGRVYSYSSRPRLGVRAQDTEEGKGVKVIGIDDNSVAEKAGLKEGDIITEFDGKAINDTDELAKAAREAREKSAVTVKINRGGKTQTIELKTPRKLKTTSL